MIAIYLFKNYLSQALSFFSTMVFFRLSPNHPESIKSINLGGCGRQRRSVSTRVIHHFYFVTCEMGQFTQFHDIFILGSVSFRRDVSAALPVIKLRKTQMYLQSAQPSQSKLLAGYLIHFGFHLHKLCR